MHRRRIEIVTGCLLLALSATPAFAGPRGQHQDPSGPLVITVGEARQGPGRLPVPTLVVRTTRHFSCYDCTIAGTLKRRGRVLRVTLGRVVCPSLCSLMEGPATYRTPLGVTDGVYTLEVASGSRVDRWSLVISGSRPSLTPEAARFTAAPQLTPGRLPRGGLEVQCRWPATTREPSVGPCERLFLAIAQVARPLLVARYPARARNAYFSLTGEDRELERTVKPLLVKGLMVHLLLPRGTLLICSNGRCDRFTRPRPGPAEMHLDLIR